MGAVYLAEHPLIGKKVALKVIHRELAANKEVVTRFFNEARAVNKIGNEHIVEIHDFGQSDEGEHFYIMEYLHGRTLAQVLEQERMLPAARALHISAQIANGLAAAHTCGIIHRDLKPDNIMLLDRLGDHDFVKVLDFGLAKMIHDTASQKLTAAGVVLGTPQYMSPEACESKPTIDHRSDIYCLGILLFQMLTGRVPFEGESMGEILVKHVSQPPPAPRGLNPEIPPSVEQIVLRCLAKLPDARFPTMKALREALLDADRYLASSPPVMPSAAVHAAPNEKTMFGADAQQARAGLGVASTVPPDADDGRKFALAPPPPSVSGGVAAAAAPSAKTAYIDPGQGGAPLGAAPAAAAAPDQKTAFLDAPPAPAGGNGAAAEQKTAFMDAAAAPAVAAPEMPKRSTTAVPEMNPPAPAANATMVIGTPEGYSDKPPTKKWPIVVALFAVLAVVGGGVAFLVLSGGDGAKSARAAPAGDPAAAPAADDEPAADPPAEEVAPPEPPPAEETTPPPAPEIVIITVKTKPEEAEIWLDGEKVGETPMDLEIVKGTEQEVILKRSGYKDRTETLEANFNREVTLRLERARRSSSSSSRSSPRSSKTGKTGKSGKSGKSGKDGPNEGDTFKPDFGP